MVRSRGPTDKYNGSVELAINNFDEEFAQLLEPSAGVLITTFTCAQLLLSPIELTTRLAGSGKGAGIRSFIICLNITSAAHPEHGFRRRGRCSI